MIDWVCSYPSRIRRGSLAKSTTAVRTEVVQDRPCNVGWVAHLIRPPTAGFGQLSMYPSACGEDTPAVVATQITSTTNFTSFLWNVCSHSTPPPVPDPPMSSRGQKAQMKRTSLRIVPSASNLPTLRVGMQSREARGRPLLITQGELPQSPHRDPQHLQTSQHVARKHVTEYFPKIYPETL